MLHTAEVIVDDNVIPTAEHLNATVLRSAD
jgi:hypothetical protein